MATSMITISYKSIDFLSFSPSPSFSSRSQNHDSSLLQIISSSFPYHTVHSFMMLALVKIMPALLLGLSVLPTTLAEPLPAYKPASTTCPLVQKTYETVTTLTTLAPPDCPTATATKVNPCSPGVTASNCIRPQCVRLATTTVGCPGVCCPKKEPTTTTTYECSIPCSSGCGVIYTTETVGCPPSVLPPPATPTA